MSGIFKGDSIYKSGGGGGGGGYKDGGELVDGDFIKVENNTISSYDNASRDPVNFYFEAADGDVLNSVVELTTAVNATVHVYTVDDGLFIPIGNIGGNTVIAGEEYNIKVVGNSFSIEQVTPGSKDPEFAEINGTVYSVAKIQNKLVLVEDYKGPFIGETRNIGNTLPSYPESIITGCGCIIYKNKYFYNIGKTPVTDLSNFNFMDNLNNPWKVFNNGVFNNFSNDEITKFNLSKLGYLDTQNIGGEIVLSANYDIGIAHYACRDTRQTPNRSVYITEYELNHGLTGAAMGGNEFVTIRLYRDL